MPKLLKKAFSGLFMLFLASQAFAQMGPLYIDVADCVLMQSPIQRFACYEGQASAALTGNPDAAATPPPAAVRQPAQPRPNVSSTPPRPTPAPTVADEPAAAPAPTPAPAAVAVSENNFGLIESDDKKARPELFAVISGLEENVPNQYTITLDNGMVWRQTVANSRMRIQTGDHVRIYTSRWGADYRLSVEERSGFIQVQRVK